VAAGPEAMTDEAVRTRDACGDFLPVERADLDDDEQRMLQLAAAEDPEVVPFCAPVPIPVPYPNNGFSWGQKGNAYANGVGDKNFFLEP
jgi:hypothetical protein